MLSGTGKWRYYYRKLIDLRLEWEWHKFLAIWRSVKHVPTKRLLLFTDTFDDYPVIRHLAKQTNENYSIGWYPGLNTNRRQLEYFKRTHLVGKIELKKLPSIVITFSTFYPISEQFLREFTVANIFWISFVSFGDKLLHGARLIYMTKNYGNYYFYYHFIRNIIVNGGHITPDIIHDPQAVKSFRANRVNHKRYEKFIFYAKQLRRQRKRFFVCWARQVRNSWALYRTGRRIHKNYWKRYNKKLWLRAIVKTKSLNFAQRPGVTPWTQRELNLRNRLLHKGLKFYQKALKKKIHLKRKHRKLSTKQKLKSLKLRRLQRKKRAKREVKLVRKLFKSTSQHHYTAQFFKKHKRILAKYWSETGTEPARISKLPPIYKQSSMRILAAYKKWRRVGSGTRRKTKSILYSYFKYVPGSLRPLTEEEKAEIQRRRDEEEAKKAPAAAAGSSGDNKKPPTDEGKGGKKK